MLRTGRCEKRGLWAHPREGTGAWEVNLVLLVQRIEIDDTAFT
jgi:hypothetical protein